MPKRSLQIVLLVFIGVSLPAFAAEETISMLQVTEKTPIANLVWTQKTLLSKESRRVLLEGSFRQKDWAIFLNGKPIKVDKTHQFRLSVQLSFKYDYSSFVLEARGPGGGTASQTVILGIEAPDKSKAPDMEMQKKHVPVTAVSDLSEPSPPEPLFWTSSVGLGTSLFTIEQDQIPSVAQVYLSVEGMVETRMLSQTYSGVKVTADLVSLAAGAGGRNLRMLSFHPYLAFRPFTSVTNASEARPGRFRLDVDIGVIYTTSYANPGDFGFSDFISPALGITGRLTVSDRVAIFANLGYALLKAANASWAGGNANWTIELESQVSGLIGALPTGFSVRYSGMNLGGPQGDLIYRHSGVTFGIRQFLH